MYSLMISPYSTEYLSICSFLGPTRKPSKTAHPFPLPHRHPLSHRRPLRPRPGHGRQTCIDCMLTCSPDRPILPPGLFYGGDSPIWADNLQGQQYDAILPTYKCRYALPPRPRTGGSCALWCCGTPHFRSAASPPCCRARSTQWAIVVIIIKKNNRNNTSRPASPTVLMGSLPALRRR